MSILSIFYGKILSIKYRNRDGNGKLYFGNYRGGYLGENYYRILKFVSGGE